MHYISINSDINYIYDDNSRRSNSTAHNTVLVI